MVKELKVLIDKLNKNCTYLVLRNWDTIYDEESYLSGSDDIDVLCDNKKAFIELTRAIPVHKNGRSDNYLIPCGSSYVHFDIRWVGDGYYPKKWEKKMLDNRIMSELGFYVLSNQDYGYSIAYHALLQKRELSEKYDRILNDFFGGYYNDSINARKDSYLGKLYLFLKDNSYGISYPHDPGVRLNVVNIRGPYRWVRFRLLLRQYYQFIKAYL